MYLHTLHTNICKINVAWSVVIIDCIISNNDAFQTSSDIELLIVEVQGTPARSNSECLQSDDSYIKFTSNA